MRRHLTRNANDVLVGPYDDRVRKVAAFTYEVKSESGRRGNASSGLVGVIERIERLIADTWYVDNNRRFDIRYLVYVDRLNPPRARCQCEWHLVNGGLCKHGKLAIEAANHFKQLDLAQYKNELADRALRRGY